MREVSRKIISITMAFVVLFTTMSFTLDMHYCGDTLVDVALFKDAKSCEMEKMQVASTCGNAIFSQKSCCSDKQLIVKGQEDLKNSFDTLTIEQQIFVTALFYSYVDLFENYDEDSITDEDYRPPYVKQNLLVLHQTFLI